MKINKYAFIFPILFIGILYLLGAFTAADFNSMNWDPFGRFVFSLLSIVLIVAGGMLSQEVK